MYFKTGPSFVRLTWLHGLVSVNKRKDSVPTVARSMYIIASATISMDINCPDICNRNHISPPTHTEQYRSLGKFDVKKISSLV